jgi:hypothetical protein
MRRTDRILGCCWMLYDQQQNRAAIQAHTTRTELRALYAAAEVFVTLLVAAEQSDRGALRLWLSGLRLAWRAGLLVGRLSVLATSEADRG